MGEGFPIKDLRIDSCWTVMTSRDTLGSFQISTIPKLIQKVASHQEFAI